VRRDAQRPPDALLAPIGHVVMPIRRILAHERRRLDLLRLRPAHEVPDGARVGDEVDL
jgi:hypothetical protein